VRETLIVDHRFRGPPDSGNGGYVAGRLAALVGGPAEVTLRLPTPLDRPLSVLRRGGGDIALMDGEALVAEARPAEPTPEPRPALDFAAADRAAETGRRNLAERNIFATCFVCGPARAPGDGLRMVVGEAGDDLYAGPWVPEVGFAGADGRVDPVFVWSALDCPSAMALLAGKESPLLLGRLTARVRRCPEIGEPTVLMAWPLGQEEGRRSHAASALYDADGACLALAHAVWFRPRPGF
jgi:hypothetical protein